MLDELVDAIVRFETNLAHFVCDARLTNGRKFVVHLTRLEQAREFSGDLYWYQRLKSLGVPLPALYYEDIRGTRHDFPVMIMERLPGAAL